MDIDEYSLTDTARTLTRLGVTHVWRTVAPEPAAQMSSAEQETALLMQKNTPLVLRPLFHGKQPPIHTLWTYTLLHEDLKQESTPPRLDVFQKIQKSVREHLNWPENALCAWPLDQNLELFRQGLEHFQPQILICFGPCPPLSPRGDNRFTFEGLQGYLLPSLDDMAQGNRSLKNLAWKILSSL